MTIKWDLQTVDFLDVTFHSDQKNINRSANKLANLCAINIQENNKLIPKTFLIELLGFE